MLLSLFPILHSKVKDTFAIISYFKTNSNATETLFIIAYSAPDKLRP